MWILKFTPDWLFSLIFFISILAYFILDATKRYTVYKPVVALVLLFSVYMTGMVSNNNNWLKKVADLEKQVIAQEVVSVKTNASISSNIADAKNSVNNKTQAIIQYIDREVVKYDESCVLPKEALEAINKAAKK